MANQSGPTLSVSKFTMAGLDPANQRGASAPPTKSLWRADARQLGGRPPRASHASLPTGAHRAPTAGHGDLLNKPPLQPVDHDRVDLVGVFLLGPVAAIADQGLLQVRNV